ncbi:hypothetical protein FB45DRAFT_1055825 [Roridomyces roridus]|uniref:Uncharacterized protein n=1 Tax=Roridomyces roridus TaxID=1738132 RepID=A0AAD7C159_9AGAR|nr:hypothetical protein FB45DRAFT_1055825 [Roridomyces roridus]
MPPQELIDAIVDFVPDKPSLEACAISARAFVAPAQRRLFQRLELPRRDPFDPTSFERSQKHLQRAATMFYSSSPHLADFVLDLEIADGNSDCGPMLTLLRSLHKVRRLRFRGTLEFDYSDVFYSGLIDFIRQPSMQTIVLDVRTDGASALFTAALKFCRNICVNLRTYEDGHDIVPGNIQEHADEGADVPQPIENLIMARSSGMSARLLRPELKKHLRRVQRADIYRPDETLLASLASSCSALTTVAIQHWVPPSTGTAWLSSLRFPTVTLFELSLPMDGMWHIRLAEVVPQLSSCFPNIAELRLHFSLFVPPSSATNDPRYAELDTPLSDFISDSKRKVNIILRYMGNIEHFPTARFRGYFDGVLPRTRRRGGLAIFHSPKVPTCPDWDPEDDSYGVLPLDRVGRAAGVAVYGEEMDGTGLLAL